MPEALIEEPAMVALANLAAQVPPGQVIVEVGTHHGANLVRMATAAKAGCGAHVYGIDPYGHGDIYQGRPHMLARYTSADHDIALDNIRKHHVVRNTTIIVATSQDAANTWPGLPIGLLIIDAEHRYNSIHADYTAWQPHLSDNAIVAFDDYGGSVGAEVKRAVDDLAATSRIDPVLTIIGERLALARPSRAPRPRS